MASELIAEAITEHYGAAHKILDRKLQEIQEAERFQIRSIAAREACDTWQLPECEFKKLDRALEPFGERIPYENEPDALPAAPTQEAEA